MINLNKRVICKGLATHRSGWPFVLGHLANQCSEDGVAFDDFVDASYSYRPLAEPYRVPWVGIFHHPPLIKSPLRMDQSMKCQAVLRRSKLWPQSALQLKGCVCLSHHLADVIAAWLDAPVLVIKHPTDTDVPQWNVEAYLSDPAIYQVGFFLRDTRAIFRIPHLLNVRFYRSKPYLIWQVRRDRRLRRRRSHLEVERNVEDLPRLDDSAYDEIMTRCVMLTHLFGASANNVVVECMARNAPLLVNKIAPVVEYLGEEYPLYYNNLAEVPELLKVDRVMAAHKYLREMDKSFLDAASFARQVAGFAAACV